jgi:hypothetical protein
MYQADFLCDLVRFLRRSLLRRLLSGDRHQHFFPELKRQKIHRLKNRFNLSLSNGELS